jgi:hypothetical protein
MSSKLLALRVVVGSAPGGSLNCKYITSEGTKAHEGKARQFDHQNYHPMVIK